MDKNEEVFEVVTDLTVLAIKLLALLGTYEKEVPAERILEVISGMGSRIAELLEMEDEVCQTLMIKAMAGASSTKKIKEIVKTMQEEGCTTMGTS